jgi:LacI family transcriptional regulator
MIGIDAVLQEKGYSLLVSRLTSSENPLKHIKSLLSRRADGIIWSVPEREDSHRWVEAARQNLTVPIVLAFCTARTGYSSMWLDNFSGGYQATKHFLEHGYRKIGHIIGPWNYVEAKERMAGWEKALQEAGIEPVIHSQGTWQMDGGARAMEDLLSRWPDIEAVFASNDRAALGAMSVLRQQGLRVPEDVRLIGFDDHYALVYTDPPLTTIRQDYNSLGICAVRELFSRIEDPTTKLQSKVIPVDLILRQSCGCRPNT